MDKHELRLEIAKQRGWTPNGFMGEYPVWKSPDGTNTVSLPHWTEKIEDVWPLAEEMADQGDLFIESWNDDEWFIANHPLTIKPRALASCDGKTTGKRDICLAICRAWLEWNAGKNRYDMEGEYHAPN